MRHRPAVRRLAGPPAASQAAHFAGEQEGQARRPLRNTAHIQTDEQIHITRHFPQAANQTAGFAEHTRYEVAIIVDAVGFGGMVTEHELTGKAVAKRHVSDLGFINGFVDAVTSLKGGKQYLAHPSV